MSPPRAAAFPAPLLARARDRFDLTEPADQDRLYELAEALLAAPDISREMLRASASDAGVPLELKLAAKLVESRRILADLDTPL
jgi:hypothetical protein